MVSNHSPSERGGAGLTVGPRPPAGKGTLGSPVQPPPRLPRSQGRDQEGVPWRPSLSCHL